MIKEYYYLAKPGIVYGNLITTTAGFFLASAGHINLKLFVFTLVGIAFVMGSGCVFNNINDQTIDAKMDRTKNRATVTGVISKSPATIYGYILLLIGILALWFTNSITLTVALVGFVVYVFVYTPLKPRTVHATLIGAIAGAVPPVVGFTAVSGKLDLGAIILFLILVCWQMAHFYSIAIFRLDDYTNAGIPVLPAKTGILRTKILIMIYILMFVITAGLLTVAGLTSYYYLVAVAILGFTWLWFGVGGFAKNIDHTLWAKKMFRFSLIVLTFLSIFLSIDAIIFK